MGPIPPPEDLERYASIIPNGADRIMAMAEGQTAHRQELERTIIAAQIADAELGEIGLTAIVSGAIVAAHGQPWAGVGIGGSAVVGLVSVFVYGQRRDRASSESQSKPNAFATARA